MENHLAEMVGYAAGFLRMISFMPQLAKTFKTRKADDLSIPTLIITAVTTALFILYAILLGLTPIYITLSILEAMLFFQIALTFRYSTRWNRPRSVEAGA
jgi:MtN3 and saliva related transmembrane protein